MDNKIPDKIKDQHIIVDKSVMSKIANAASLTEHDSVLEIGGGPGNLTKAIAAHAGQVYAIEKDPGYIMELKKIFGGSRKIGNAMLDALWNNGESILQNRVTKVEARRIMDKFETGEQKKQILENRDRGFCRPDTAPYGKGSA